MSIYVSVLQNKPKIKYIQMSKGKIKRLTLGAVPHLSDMQQHHAYINMGVLYSIQYTHLVWTQ